MSLAVLNEDARPARGLPRDDGRRPGARCGSSSPPREQHGDDGRQAALRRDGHPHPPRRREGLRPGRSRRRWTRSACPPSWPRTPTSTEYDEQLRASHQRGHRPGRRGRRHPGHRRRRRRVLRPGRHARAQGRGRRPALGRLRARRRHARLLRAQAHAAPRARSSTDRHRPRGPDGPRTDMRVHIGGDHAAYDLKLAPRRATCSAQGHDVVDHGPDVLRRRGRLPGGRAACRRGRRRRRRAPSASCSAARATASRSRPTRSEPGPRGYRWRADQPATRALGRGARRRRPQEQGAVPRQGGRRSRRRSPAQPAEFAKTEWRYGGINYTDTGIALLTENDRASRRTRTWIMEPGAAPRKVWDRKQDAAYDDPGTPVTRRDTGADAAAVAADAAAPAAARSSRTATSSTSPATARRRKAIVRSSIG